MEIDLSDEEFVLPDQQLIFALTLPEVGRQRTVGPSKVRAATAADNSSGAIPVKTDSAAKAAQGTFEEFACRGRHSSSGKVVLRGARLQKGLPLNRYDCLQGLSSQRKPVGTSNAANGKLARVQKRSINAIIFSESDDEPESTSGQLLAQERKRQPARLFCTAKLGLQEDKLEDAYQVLEPDILRRRKRPDSNMLQQLQEAGQELQEDEIDSVLKRCEQLSCKLRGALNVHDKDRYSACVDTPAALISPEALFAACGEAARYLKPYQVVGVNFLMLLKQQGIQGSILADEMGLGKTAQAICFLGVLKHAGSDSGPHLVVAPASLLENWQRELQRWCPGLKVVTYYGTGRAALRQQLLHHRQTPKAAVPSVEVITISDSEASGGDATYDGKSLEPRTQHVSDQSDCASSDSKQAPFDVMLTCYTLFERDSVDQQADRSFLKKWHWSHLVLDEAHAVKNASAMRTKRLTRVAQRCKRRIMLTGTPLQNDLDELQNLLQFLLPDIFSRKEINQSADLQEEKAVQQLTERMKAVLGPFVLRRLKTEVASQLTAKQQHEEVVIMTPEQAALYQKAVEQLRAEVALKSTGKVSESAGQAVVKQLGKQRINNLFTHLRKIAQHPLLVRSLYSDDQLQCLAATAHKRQLFGGGCTQVKVSEELLMYSDHRLHDFALHHNLHDFLLDDEAVLSSAKCQLMVELLRDLQSKGSRPLIFSQWTSVLDILGWLLEIMGLTYARLDGSTAVADRLSTVDMFNNPANNVFAFLLSTRAGGQGLNLTGADTVILHDVDFNPQIDRQAEDRCHRLGQTKSVHVYRLVTKNTVDEGIHALAKRKLKLDAAVLEGITAQSNNKANITNTEAAQMGQLLQSLIAGSEYSV